jgi:uncharacterized coiled-coil protein SlyX
MDRRDALINELRALIAKQAAQLERQAAQLEKQAARIAELELKLAKALKDSSPLPNHHRAISRSQSRKRSLGDRRNRGAVVSLATSSTYANR